MVKHIVTSIILAGLFSTTSSFAKEQEELFQGTKISDSISSFEESMLRNGVIDEEAYIQEYVLKFGNGDDGKAYERASFCQGREAEYIVNVHTSDIYRAGTDSRIHMQINWGGGTSSNWARLDVSGRDDFEQGAVNDFYVFLRNNGSLANTALTIKSDGSGDKHGWHLDRVTIEDTCTGEVATARFNRWISKSVGLISTRRMR